MAHSGFGRTWWGNAWIEALKKSGLSNDRLEEGRIYAAKGNVKGIKIEGREVVSFFRDNETFTSKIRLREFSKEEKGQVESIIKGNPALSLDLSLGKLPEKIPEIMDKKGIPLFPTSWQKIESSCTCSQKERPCTHLSAAFYLLANEIDKNPILLFNLRGIKTDSLMKNAGLLQVEEINRQNGDFEFTPYSMVKTKPFRMEEAEPDLNFDDINIRSLFTLLPDNPLFYNEGNFKLILIEKYKSLASYAETINIENEIPSSLSRLKIHLLFEDKKGKGDSAGERKELFIFSAETYVPNLKTEDEQVLINLPEASGSILKPQKRKMKTAAKEDVMNYFLSLPLDVSSENSSRSAAFLNLASSIALGLVRTFSFIPELRLNEDKSFSLQYIPLIHDEKTSSAMALLKEMAPENFALRKSDLSVMKSPAFYLLSEFITHIVHQHEMRLGRNFYFLDRKIYNAFFKGEKFIPEKFDEKSYARMVLDWLERLAFRKRTIQPEIIIESLTHDSYSVKIKVKSKGGKTPKTLGFQEIFRENKSLPEKDMEVIRTETLREVKIASEYFPQLNTLLDTRGKKTGVLTSEEIFEFITRTSDTLRLLGIKVTLPREIKELAEPKLILTAKDTGSYSGALTYFSLKDLLEFQWQIAIGDASISLEEFRRLSESSRGIVKVNDRYILIDPEKARNILSEIDRKPEEFTPRDILQAFLTGEFKGRKFIPGEALKKKLSNLLKPEDVDYPKNLKTSLRPYQKTGFRWLYTNVVKGFGCCLADDMGLGKTVEAIALMLRFKEEGRLNPPAIVICPTTLVGNWYKELKRFAPDLKVFVYHGSQRRLGLKNVDIVITTYGTLRSDEEKFGKYSWKLGVIDEAQNIKNPDAAQTRAVKSLTAENRIAMSGTPVENRITELWSIFDFINAGYLGTLGSFKKNFSVPIEKYRDREKTQRLKKLTSPFILRRLKTDENIIKDLPDKIVFDEYCYLTKDQTVLYEQVVKSALSELKASLGPKRKGEIFKLITSLKQICNHPSQYTKESDFRKELSGKSEKTIGLLEKLLQHKEKVLLFTQYKQMGDILQKMIQSDLKENVFFFHGSLRRQQRDKMITEFQTTPETKIMIVSLKAGGTGLNLTAAARVIHYDLWWNPAVETQATDRTYRIGQMRNVTVHRLITLGTFEEKIDDMIKQKKELFDLTISAGENWITELSERELKKLFSLNDH